MVKGIQRRFVEMKLVGSKTYESAYFILKRGSESQKSGEQELLEEARKIVSSFDTDKKKAKGGRIVRILLYPLLFLIGAALGFVVSLCFFG